MLVFMAGWLRKREKISDWHKFNQAYEVIRARRAARGGEGEFICPSVPDDDLGGWVTVDYCESFGEGRGCKLLKTCKRYLAAKQAMG